MEILTSIGSEDNMRFMPRLYTNEANRPFDLSNKANRLPNWVNKSNWTTSNCLICLLTLLNYLSGCYAAMTVTYCNRRINDEASKNPELRRIGCLHGHPETAWRRDGCVPGRLESADGCIGGLLRQMWALAFIKLFWGIVLGNSGNGGRTTGDVPLVISSRRTK